MGGRVNEFYGDEFKILFWLWLVWRLIMLVFVLVLLDMLLLYCLRLGIELILGVIRFPPL